MHFKEGTESGGQEEPTDTHQRDDWNNTMINDVML